MERESKYREPMYGFDDHVLDEIFDGNKIPELKRATKSQRLANYILDQFILGCFMLLTFIIMGLLIGFFEDVNGSVILTTRQDMVIGSIFMLGLSSYFLYFIICEYFLNGRTFGKLVTNTKVVMPNGNPPGFWPIIGRTILRYLPFEPLSFLLAGDDGWHDKLSGTIVIQNVE